MQIAEVAAEVAEEIMARSDLLINLVRSGASGDVNTLKKTVEAIVAEERAKQHNVVADRIEKAYRSVYGSNSPQHASKISHAPSEQVGRARDFITEIVPRRRLDDLIIPDTSAEAIRQLIEEQQRASILRSHSLEPRHSALFVGPPGNGKTSLAEAVAESLAVPFFVVRYEAIIGSFLGETASRMRRVFDYAKTTPCVLFFDEFDAVGKERGDIHETGEIKRVVTSLLMQMDDLPSYVVVIAATNHSELLDRAVWRRFQVRIPLPQPTQKQVASYLTHLSYQSNIHLGISSDQISRALGRISFSEAEQFFLDVARRQVLSDGKFSTSAIAKKQLKIWTQRVRAPEIDKWEEDAGTSST